MSRDSREEKHCSWLLSCSVARLLKGQLDPATEQPRNPATLNCTIAGLMKGSSRHAVLAGFLGWTLDAFDFFVVVFLLDVLAAVAGGRVLTTLPTVRDHGLQG